MKLSDMRNLRKPLPMVEGEKYSITGITYSQVPDRWAGDGSTRGVLTADTDKGAIYLPGTVVRAYEEMLTDGDSLEECQRQLVGHTVECIMTSYKGKSFKTIRWTD